jgi:hypothetical protein
VQDYRRLLKPAGYELARLYADRLVSLVRGEDKVTVHLVNDGAAALEGTLIVEVLSTLTGDLHERRELPVQALPGERKVAHSISITALDPTATAIRATVATEDEELTDWTFLAEPKDMRLGQPRFRILLDADGLTLEVQGAAFDLVLYDMDDPENLHGATPLPGWEAVTLVNQRRAYTYKRRPQRIGIRSLAGLQVFEVGNT